MTRREWLRLGAFGGVIAGLNILGWSLLTIAALQRHFAIGFGVGITAWLFGFRHAFDADHISVIDNTTRKLIADGKKPLGVGFFFSLGHSTIVFGLALALAFFAQIASSQLGDASQLKNVGGYVGTAISSFFLYVIAAVNLLILAGIIRVFRRMRHGHYEASDIDLALPGGIFSRLLRPIAGRVNASWQMYPVGFLFGLGFDTATEVGLLALAGGAAAGGLPWYATLSLPILFAGGMCLMDTADGAFMNVAYGWAFTNPLRKVFYNLTITSLSVAIALLVATAEALSLVARYFNLNGAFWHGIRSLDMTAFGLIIVGMFVLTWVVALSVWRFGRIETR